MSSVVLALRHFYDRPYMAVSLVITLLGALDTTYALAPYGSVRYRLLRILFWALYPLLLLTFFTGRKARTDPDTHLVYGLVVLGVGLAGVLVAWIY